MIGIIDYGMGNIQSVQNAFLKVGGNAEIVKNGDELAYCDGLVLPGVGAFSKAMQNLEAQRIIEPLKQLVANGTPLFGICLGLQLLGDSSEEFGDSLGLGLIPGRVIRIPIKQGYHLPHIGWNSVNYISPQEAGIFRGVKDGSSFYFVHSYMFDCDPSFIVAVTDHGTRVTAAIHSGNIFGAQFHPEKSQTNGLQLLKNFIELVAKHKESKHGQK